MLQFFEKILPLAESLWSFRLDKISEAYFRKSLNKNDQGRVLWAHRESTPPKPLFSLKPLDATTWLRSLLSSVVLYFMGMRIGAARGLWHHQTYSPSWLPFLILPRIRNQVKTATSNNTLNIKYFASFYSQVFLLSLAEVEKTYIFIQKWLDHLLLMTLYFVTMVTDHHLTYLKMHARDKRTAAVNVGCLCLIF